MKVLFASAEVAPFSKVGGLGDVAGALPKALQKLGIDVRVVTPRYGSINSNRFEPRAPASIPSVQVPVGSHVYEASIWEASLPRSDVPVYFLGSTDFFDRPGVYEDPRTGQPYGDEIRRFAFFGRGVLEVARAVGFRPHIVHLNEFHTALAAGYQKLRSGKHSSFHDAKTVFTIHNLAYQGSYPIKSVQNLGLPRSATTPLGPLEFHGRANFMKLGIVLADAVTTVSPTYAREIQESPKLGMGLEGILRSRSDSLKGILNGIDYAVWDPRTDPFLPTHYSTEDLAGKAMNRGHLLKAFGWDQRDEGPIVAMIGRLAVQKGWDLVLDAARRMVKLGLRLVVLGTGDKDYERGLALLNRRHPTRVGTALRFDEALAHLMEAGSDIFLMPSRYEPCGLNQMISLRYGTIPVVKATGGLRDTVSEFDPATHTGNGFLFSQHAPEGMLQALARAARLYRDKPMWKKLVRNAMRSNCSWEASAVKYAGLYEELIARG